MFQTHQLLKTPSTTHATSSTPARSYRKHAIVVGVFFLVTDVTAIAAALLYEPFIQDADFVTSTGSDFPLRLGAFLEILLAIGILGTALALYPVLKRRNQPLASAYIVGRALEAAIIIVGILSLLAVLTLRSGFAPGADDPATYTAVSQALIALHDWTFLFGPHVVLSLNATILGYLLVSSKLVPRWIGLIALVDGPLLFASSVAMLFGAYEPTSPIAISLGLPMLAFEVSFAVWLIAKGFDRKAVASLDARDA